MIIEAVLVLDAAFRDGTIGLAAQLATMPREGSDAAPLMPTIMNEAEHQDAGLDRLPDGDLSYLLISTAVLDQRLPSIQPQRDAMVECLIRWGRRKARTDDALREASYITRASLRVLSLMTTTAAGEALRTRNRVCIRNVESVRTARLTAPADDVVVSYGIFCTLRCADYWALNLS